VSEKKNKGALGQRSRRAPDQKENHILDSRAGRMSTKIGSQQETESRGQYRRREDQYLCIEMQP